MRIVRLLVVLFYLPPLAADAQLISYGSANKDLEKETRRVISMSPKWQPGRLGDKPVSVKFSCPILFKFE